MSSAWLDVVGIGEDGFSGLRPTARDALEQAGVIIGGDRHPSLPGGVQAERRGWPHPFDALIEELLTLRDRRPVILCAGDPLWFSIGARIIRAIPAEEIIFHPQLSAFQFAACRLGWSLADCETLTAHRRPHEQIIPYFWPGARLLVLTSGPQSPGAVARLLASAGYPRSRLTVLGALGGAEETRLDAVAEEWAQSDPAKIVPPLHLLAVECRGHPTQPLPRVPGLPDEAFARTAPMTGREARAAALADLMPARGLVLWDIGTGCGSVAIEWMRSAPDAEAVGFDPDPAQLALAKRNADALGAPRLGLSDLPASEALCRPPSSCGAGRDLLRPDAIFIGAGLSAETIDAAWQSIGPFGRLVVQADDTRDQDLLGDFCRSKGGAIVRITAERADLTGDRLNWRAATPVIQWSVRK